MVRRFLQLLTYIHTACLLRVRPQSGHIEAADLCSCVGVTAADCAGEITAASERHVGVIGLRSRLEGSLQ